MSKHVAWKNPDGTLGTSSNPNDVPPGATAVEGDVFASRRADYAELVATAAPDPVEVAALIAANQATDLAALILSGIPEPTARRMLGA